MSFPSFPAQGSSKQFEERTKKMLDLLEKIEPFISSTAEAQHQNLDHTLAVIEDTRTDDIFISSDVQEIQHTPHEEDMSLSKDTPTSSIDPPVNGPIWRQNLVNLDGTPVTMLPQNLARKPTYLDLMTGKPKSKVAPKHLFSACGPVESAVMKFPDHSADWPVLIAKDAWESIGPFICPKLSFRRGELLLHMWTDFGQVSRLSVVKGVVSIREHNYDLNKLRKHIEDPGLLLQFEKFCHQLDSVLERPHRKLMSSTSNLHYRILWTVYTIFDRIMNCTLHSYADIVDICQNGPTKYYDRPSSATKIKNCSIIDSRSHVKKILGLLNPNVEHFLAHASPLRRFIIAYGRYLQIQCQDGHNILRRNCLHDSIKEVYEKLSLSLLDHKTQLPFILEALVTSASISDLTLKSFVNIPRLRTPTPASKFSQNKSTTCKGSKKLRPSTASATKKLTPTTTRSAGDVGDNLGELEETPAKRKIARKKICMYFCKYPFIRTIAEDKGFIEVDDQEEWNLLWSDTAINLEHLPFVAQMQDPKRKFGCQRDIPVYKMNHFPGMEAISRKDTLSKNIGRMKKLFGDAFDFIPISWTTPNEVDDLLKYAARNKKAVYISKPNNGSQGKGISVITNLNKMIPFTNSTYQTYIQRPFLIDGLKFDLRIYVLVTSVEPLVIYIYPEGLARFATVEYQPPTTKNVGVKTMHLTNTSLNKYHASYTPEKNKRKMTEVFQLLSAAGVDIGLVQSAIDDVIIKTVIAGHSELLKSYRTSFPNGSPHGSICFELLGFDIILDENLKAYILETNRAPSFSSDIDVDFAFKYSVIYETFEKIYFGPMSDLEDKAFVTSQLTSQIKAELLSLLDVGLPKGYKKQFIHESLHGRRWRLIYPLKDTCTQYSKYFVTIANHPDELTAMSPSGRMQWGSSVRVIQQTMKPIKRPVTQGSKGKRKRRGLYSLVPPPWKKDKGNLRYRDIPVEPKSEKPANLHMSLKSIQIMKSPAYKDRKPIWQRPSTQLEMPAGLRKLAKNSTSKMKKERKSSAGYNGPRLDVYYLNCPAYIFAEMATVMGLKLNYEDISPKRKKTPPAKPKTKPKTPEPPKTLSAQDFHMQRKNERLDKLRVMYNLPPTSSSVYPASQRVKEVSTQRGKSLPIVKLSPPKSSTLPRPGSSKKTKPTESKPKVKKSTDVSKRPETAKKTNLKTQPSAKP